MLTLPQTSEYALRAIYMIAEAPNGELVRVADIAAALKLPQNYLSKTLHQLASAGVLHSTRGRHGGFRLAKPAASLTLAEVVGPFLPAAGRSCVLGRPRCNDKAPCPAHWRWKEVADQMRVFFGETTIADLIQGAPAVRPPARPRAQPRRVARP